MFRTQLTNVDVTDQLRRWSELTNKRDRIRNGVRAEISSPTRQHEIFELPFELWVASRICTNRHEEQAMPMDTEPSPPPEDTPPEVQDGYSLQELQRNRRWNVVLTAAILTGSWSSCYFGVISGDQAKWTTILTLIVATLYRWLFASKSSVKLDENGPGMGKHVHPRTMGGVLGYLNNGFKDW